MPPVKIQKPDFSTIGRYLIDVDARKIARLESSETFFHDLENFQEGCQLSETKTSSMSRFNNLNWALQRGYKKCPNCMG